MQAKSNNGYYSVERHMGSLKFAVIIIAIFALFMIAGTFLESYYGTEFANRFLYKRAPFMLVQACMFISILYAFFLRLPWKKQLSGFYMIHTGLIVTGIGSFATYDSGIDGNMTLMPRTPTRTVALSKDELAIHFPASGRTVTYVLPYSAFAVQMDEQYNDIKLKTFYPFAETQLEWIEPQSQYNEGHSTRYRLQNANFGEEFVLSMHPEAREFESNLSLGPLSIHYLPRAIAECFTRTGVSQLILWDSNRNSCFTPEEKNIPVKETSSGKRFLVVKSDGEFHSFFPEFSPFSMDKDFNVNPDGPIRIFSQRMFLKGPHLFVFGEFAAYLENEKWVLVPLSMNSPKDLPWMGFQLSMLEHNEKKIPFKKPVFKLPIQVNGQLKQGGLKALLLSIKGKDVWVTDQRSVTMLIEGEKIEFRLQKESITIPFEVSLDHFKMDKDPGTNNPATYESFVKIFDRRGPSDAHIFMNNPLKYDWFTLYQASYFETQEGSYGSVLSVNVDPGRPLKYLGCLLLVLGAIIHYFLRRKKIQPAPLIGDSI